MPLRSHSEDGAYRSNLTSHCAEFVRLVNLDALVPHLRQMGLLTSVEVEEWIKMTTSSSRNVQVLHLLTVLERKGRQGVCGVIQALKDEKEHTGHEELADTLIQAYGE